jgi:hypothetical protein
MAFVYCLLCDVTKCAVICGDQGHTKNNLDLRHIHVNVTTHVTTAKYSIVTVNMN